MKRKGLVTILAAMVLLIASCATTPHGKATQAGKVLVAVGTTMLDTCTFSKEHNWSGPLSRTQCDQGRIAYHQAEASWELALEATKAKKPATSYFVDVVQFILQTSETLTAAGVGLGSNVSDYLNFIKGS